MKTSSIIAFFIFLLGISLSSSSQNYNTIITDQEYSDFFKQLSKNKKLRINKIDKNIVTWHKEDIYGWSDTSIYYLLWGKGVINNDNIVAHFSKDDLTFIEEQFKNINDSIWLQKDFKSFNLIGPLELNKINERSKKRNRMGNNYAYEFSLPLFSEDKKSAIIIQNFYCGFLCWTRCIYIYKKSVNGKKWLEVAKFQCIAS